MFIETFYKPKSESRSQCPTASNNIDPTLNLQYSIQGKYLPQKETKARKNKINININIITIPTTSSEINDKYTLHDSNLFKLFNQCPMCRLDELRHTRIIFKQD